MAWWRLFLHDSRWRISYTQTTRSYCGKVAYWTQRAITIAKGNGGPTSVETFERRNGYYGPWPEFNGRKRVVGTALWS